MREDSEEASLAEITEVVRAALAAEYGNKIDVVVLTKDAAIINLGKKHFIIGKQITPKAADYKLLA